VAAVSRRDNLEVSQACPHCGFENLAQSRFCAGCAAPLSETSAPARKERKQATALFADLVGSTALAEQQDPEVVQAVVGRAFDRMAQEVDRYGGLLEKFMGDALLAVFGVPTAHEDDPERAVRCALEMFSVLLELNDSFAAEGKPPLQMRVGIEAGEVLVDLERAAGPRDRMLTGDAVNTAARLQQTADPQTITVGPSVYAATKLVVDYQERAPVELKGKSDSVPAWRALRVKARRGGLRAPLGLEARLVGRDEELSVLKQTLHRVESEGRPALVTVMGPAGVGKSRLTWELQKYLDGLPQGFYWRKGRCQSYGDVSYSALAEAIKAQCEIKEDDSPELVGDKVRKAATDLFGDERVVGEIEALVGAGSQESFPRERLFDTWRAFLEKMAGRYPLVLVFEDIHWADEGLLDFIEHLAVWAQGPILMLTLARPELLDLRPRWGGGMRNYSAIYLEALSPSENEAMLDDLLSVALPDDLKHLIVERSEGNPLYTEEIVRMFIDRGILRGTEAARWELAAPVETIDVPRSIQSLIAARVDGLSTDEKEILQDASVVGRIFWSGATALLSGKPVTETREILGRLRIKEIVVPRDPPAFSDELEYSFRHALIRDVAYDSLPKSLRAEKHAAVARWAEARAGQRSEELAELIASHYVEALSYMEEVGTGAESPDVLEVKACQWARAAGHRARKLNQGREAIRWFKEAIDHASAAGLSDEEMASLWEAYARAAWGVAPMDDTADAFLTARTYYDKLNRKADIGRVNTELAVISFHRARDAEIVPLLEHALELLDPLGESKALANAYNTLGWYHWRRGNDPLVEQPLRRSIEIAEKVGARDIEGQAKQTLGIWLVYKGNWPEGLPLVEESYQIAEEIEDLNLLLRASNNLPEVLGENAPDPAREERVLRKGLELARKAGQRDFEGWILGSLAHTIQLRGRLAESLELTRQSLECARDVAEAPLVGMRTHELGWTYLWMGDIERALPLMEEGERIIETNPEPQSLVWVPFVRAYLAEANGDLEGAATLLLDAIEEYGDQLVGQAERMYFEAIRILVRLERLDEARRLLDRSRASTDGRPPAEAFALWAEALIDGGSERAVALLDDVVARFEEIDFVIERGRCLADLARAKWATGLDGSSELEEARTVLEKAEARLFLADVEVAEKQLSATN
jgi:class 3 adenylate cyclase/tetratricopeptide (TPR) repeat protein